MASSDSRSIGVIEMKPTSSRVETFFDEGNEADCTSDLIRLARGLRIKDHSGVMRGDQVLIADTEQLAAELEAEYEAVCAAIAEARS